MSLFNVGDVYKVKTNKRNQDKNGLLAGADARIAHISHTHISIRVIQFQTDVNIAVPRSLFAGNFSPDPFRAANKTYASSNPFTKIYL